MKAPRWRISALVPLVPLVVLLGHVTLMYKAALRHTGGVVSYPVDDAFIHLALAKHLAQDGVYGVSAREFTAASSSIGWPFLLAAAVKIFGAHAWLPLALNAVAGAVLVVLADRAVRALVPEATTLLRLIAGLAVVVLTPLPTLVVLGMEHTAHAAATIAFIAAASAWLAKEKADPVWPIAALAAATTLWRYEGAFPVALVALLAWRRGRFRSGVAIAATGAAPIVLFGLYAKAHGAMFLPTPVVLKGRHIELAHLGDVLGVDLMDRLGAEGAILVVLIACAAVTFLVLRRDRAWSAVALASGITTVMMLMHLELASVGWFYRYESYLLASGLLFSVVGLGTLLPGPRALFAALRASPGTVLPAALVVVLLCMPLRVRAAHANDDTPTACRNIFEQQMQSARFLAEYFPKDRVAVNDIGAVAWLGDEPMLDLMGLASLDVAPAKGMSIDKPPSLADLERLSGGVKVAIVYDEWFKEGFPSRWLRVGRWRIENSRSPAFPTVAIYATDPATYPEVIAALRRFAPTMPEMVHRSGRFVERPLDRDHLRVGDHCVLSGLGRPLDGGFPVDEEGLIPLTGVAKVLVVGLTDAGARASVQNELRKGEKAKEADALKLVAVPDRRGSVLVAGNVPRAVEIAPDTVAGSLRSVGASPSAPVFVWREVAEGFSRVERTELDVDKLVDGDILVVLPAP